MLISNRLFVEDLGDVFWSTGHVVPSLGWNFLQVITDQVIIESSEGRKSEKSEPPEWGQGVRKGHGI